MTIMRSTRTGSLWPLRGRLILSLFAYVAADDTTSWTWSYSRLPAACDVVREHSRTARSACLYGNETACKREARSDSQTGTTCWHVPANSTEVSVAVGRVDPVSGKMEVWIWPQAFTATTVVEPTGYQTPVNACTFALPAWASRDARVDRVTPRDSGAPDTATAPPGSWIVYTLDADGIPLSSRIATTQNAPNEMLLKNSATYVSALDAMVAVGGLTTTSPSACVDDPSIGFSCSAAQLSASSTGNTVLRTSVNTYVYFFANSTWLHQAPGGDASAMPVSLPPRRGSPDGFFAHGLRAAYDTRLHAIVYVGGFQDVWSMTPAALGYTPVLVLSLPSLTWKLFNATFTPSTTASAPNRDYFSTVSTGLFAMSANPARHEALLYGGVTWNHVFAGAYCFIVDLDTMVWRLQNSCSMTTTTAPVMLYDETYSVSADGSYAIVIGGRAGDPSAGWTYFTTDAWTLDLTQYVWSRISPLVSSFALQYPAPTIAGAGDVPPMRCQPPLGLPGSLVRGMLFVHGASSSDTFVLWGGLQVNASAVMYYPAFIVEPCSRYLGGQFAASDRYVASPDVFHVIRRVQPQVCRRAILILPAEALAVMAAVCMAAVVHCLTHVRKYPAVCCRCTSRGAGCDALSDAGLHHTALLLDVLASAVWWSCLTCLASGAVVSTWYTYPCRPVPLDLVAAIIVTSIRCCGAALGVTAAVLLQQTACARWCGSRPAAPASEAATRGSEWISEPSVVSLRMHRRPRALTVSQLLKSCEGAMSGAFAVSALTVNPAAVLWPSSREPADLQPEHIPSCMRRVGELLAPWRYAVACVVTAGATAATVCAYASAEANMYILFEPKLQMLRTLPSWNTIEAQNSFAIVYLVMLAVVLDACGVLLFAVRAAVTRASTIAEIHARWHALLREQVHVEAATALLGPTSDTRSSDRIHLTETGSAPRSGDEQLHVPTVPVRPTAAVPSLNAARPSHVNAPASSLLPGPPASLWAMPRLTVGSASGSTTHHTASS